MGRHLGVGAIDLGIVEASLGDARLEVVGNDLTGNAAEEGEGPAMGADPVGQGLAPGRLGICVAGGAEDGDEDLGLADLAGGAVDHLESCAGVIDEHLVAGHMGLAHGRREPSFPVPVERSQKWLRL